MKLRNGKSISAAPASRTPFRTTRRKQSTRAKRIAAAASRVANDARVLQSHRPSRTPPVPAPSSPFTFSPVDAWNPSPAPGRTPSADRSTAPLREERDLSPKKRARTPSLEIIAVATPTKKFAYYGGHQIPLNDPIAAYAARCRRSFVPLAPFEVTRGNHHVRRKRGQKIVFAYRYHNDHEALMFGDASDLPWIVPDRRRISSTSSGGFKVVEPSTPTPYEAFLFESGNRVPWLKPTVLEEFGQLTYFINKQPSTGRARQEESPPVSPSSHPTAKK